MGVFGELYLGDEFLAYTIEQPWNNNLPFESCIPAGVYRLEDWGSAKYPDSMVLTNDSLKVFKKKQEDEFARYACLMHKANWVDDVVGCIGAGEALGFGKGKWMVTNSKATTKKVLDKIKEKSQNPEY